MSLLADLHRTFYEGGKSSANNDYSGANVPFEETASPDRDTMRARARWLHENNGLISGIDESIKVNTVGNGFKLQMNTNDESLNKIIEDKYQLWEKHCDITNRQHFGDMQATILGQRMMDGEILINKKLVTDKEHPFKLQLIESDRFDTMGIKRDINYVDGIEVDTNGAPTHYHFNAGLFKSVKLQASDVIHYFKMSNRATQYRGISEYKQIIVDLRNFAGYQSSSVTSARARAHIAYAIESDNTSGRIGALQNDAEGQKIAAISGAMVHYLNKGEKLHLQDPGINGTEYGEFIRSVIRLIAVGRKISYELAFRDYTQVNFSSARASLIQDHKRFSNEQFHMASYVLNPLFEAWMDANALSGNFKGLSPQYYFSHKNELLKPTWVPPAREWIDPLKDMKALKEELALGLTTHTEAAKARGKNLDDLLEQRAKDNKKLESAGILTKEDHNA